ncbi:hypothetical protein LK10_15755 [Sinomonas humi]|uniref:Uncharacterized protein n=1 Tax=Sinomonas humi TaxID=1338436 RepID=A0A0B2ADM7_9MICC|nr:hypothetical protein LK10_15755 [Sinomonas humi]
MVASGSHDFQKGEDYPAGRRRRVVHEWEAAPRVAIRWPFCPVAGAATAVHLSNSLQHIRTNYPKEAAHG